MVTKKDRRHSGYVAPRVFISKREIIDNDLFIDSFYDEWNNYRDGFRDWSRDFKKIKNIHSRIRYINDESYLKVLQMNLKQKRLLKRRLARHAN